MTSRRDVLIVLTAAAAPAAAADPKFFSGPELELAARLADVILPRTATPGARDAQVHILLDERCAANAAIGAQWRAALTRWSQSMANGADDPEAAVEAAYRGGSADFTLLKDTVIDLYYSTREGLQQELGWNANTYLPEWTGCNHPEHQAPGGPAGQKD
jgi:hypothetical protein